MFLQKRTRVFLTAANSVLTQISYCGDYLLKYNEMHPDDIGKQIKIIKHIPNTNERTKVLYHIFITRKDIEFL